MHFVQIPITNLARRPLRTVLTALGVAIAVGGYVLMMGLSTGLDRALVGNFAGRGTDVVGVRKGAVEILATSVEARFVTDIARVPGVESAAGELVDLVATDEGETLVVCGWQPDSYLWKSVALRAGRLPRGDDTDAIVVGELTADALKVSPGSSMRLVDRVFTVVGISRASAAIVGGAVLMPLPALQSLLDRKDHVTAVHVRFSRRPPGGATGVLRDLSARFPALAFTETETLADRNYIVSMLRAIAWTTSIIGLAIGVVVVVNTLLMSVVERTREIGMLTSLGWSRGRVMAMIFLETLFITLAGAAIGTGVGAAGVRWLATATVLRGFVEAQVSWGLLAASGIAAVLLGLAASAYPAWRAVSIDAAAALRSE